MPSTNFPDQVWFDAAHPGSLHDALRFDYDRAKAAADRRPSLRRHMQDCSVCQAITTAAKGVPLPPADQRRFKVVITADRMHQLLGLPAGYEIVHMFADNEPNIVGVLVAGAALADQAADTDPDR